ncbi:MAG: DNA polymerase III subunit epsilon [Gammaproteobacteria bacterium]
MPQRQIILDTETTGLDPKTGHRIIEIGAIELIDRRFTGNNYHVYINPEREIDSEAISIHGIDNKFLSDKPVFSAIVEAFLQYISQAELIIHNAPFDLGFLDYELKLSNKKLGKVKDYAPSVFDTLAFARKKHPGQRNNLDALCKRYKVDNKERNLHGALLDATLLGKVYLAMTGGQVCMLSEQQAEQQLSEVAQETTTTMQTKLPLDRKPLRIIQANAHEKAAHAEYLAKLAHACGGKSLWREETNV